MGNMVSVIGGAMAVIIGILGLILWRGSFVVLLKGCVPILLLLGGIISLMVGISEIKETSGGKKEKK